MTAPRLARMQHFAVEVSDTDRAIAWYRRMLGFKLTERHPAGENPNIPVELTFMRIGSRHHELVIVHNPAKTYTGPHPLPADDLSGSPAFHHFAFECENRADWLATIEHLEAEGADIVRGPVLHSWVNGRGDGSWGENEAIYVLDPDGHRIEIFCDLAWIDEDGTHINAAGERLTGTKTEEL